MGSTDDPSVLARQSARQGLMEYAGVEVTIPAAELEVLHRKVGYLSSELRLAEGHAEDLDELVSERFNPPDDDSYSVYGVIEAVAAFVEAQPCTCTPEMIEDWDACPRCRVLGRRGDEPVSR